MVTANVYFGACAHHSGFEPGKAQLCSHDNVKKGKPEQGHSMRTDKSKKQNWPNTATAVPTAMPTTMPVLLLLLPLLMTAAGGGGGGGGASANAYMTHSMTQPYSITLKILVAHM